MLEKILDVFLYTFIGLVMIGLSILLVASLIQAYYNILTPGNYKVYKEANEKCYVMHGRLLTTDSKYICYGAPVNGQPMVYFEMNKTVK